MGLGASERHLGCSGLWIVGESGSRDCSQPQRLGVVPVGLCSFRDVGVPVKAVQYDGIRRHDSGGGAASKCTVAILFSNIRVRESNHHINYTTGHI